ncbi:MAG: phosphoribosylformylglycinamidine synthase, partial [Oscillospiraceae bacterium]|nr:phosphoribosylformylglycinamidine synthase [Oscillospiraceae bacterium]
MSVSRVYVEKKPEYATVSATLTADVKTALRLKQLNSIRIINRYDAQNISEEDFEYSVKNVFSEPAVDIVSYELPKLADDETVFAVEYLPGQFDQRADSCEQCIQILTGGERPLIRNARVYIVSGLLTAEEIDAIKKYIINPVESREASLEKPETLETVYEIPTEVETLTGFIDMSNEQIGEFVKKYGLAMDNDDLVFCRNYFRDEEHRDPTITEIRMIDTYWSDHCPHTTFLTEIDNVNIDADYIEDTYNDYIDARKALGREDKPITLMDIATIGARRLKAEGKLPDLDESDEINACSVKIKVDVDGDLQD